MTLDELKINTRKLGKGSYGQVHLALHKPSGIQVAVKKITKAHLRTEKIRETLQREIDIHKKLKHENIVRMYTNLEDEEHIYIVLEYIKKNNLFAIQDKKNGFTEQTAFYFFI